MNFKKLLLYAFFALLSVDAYGNTLSKEITINRIDNDTFKIVREITFFNGRTLFKRENGSLLNLNSPEFFMSFNDFSNPNASKKSFFILSHQDQELITSMTLTSYKTPDDFKVVCQTIHLTKWKCAFSINL